MSRASQNASWVGCSTATSCQRRPNGSSGKWARITFLSTARLPRHSCAASGNGSCGNGEYGRGRVSILRLRQKSLASREHADGRAARRDEAGVEQPVVAGSLVDALGGEQREDRLEVGGFVTAAASWAMAK